MMRYVLCLLLLFTFFVNCNQKSRNPAQKRSVVIEKNDMIKLNKHLLEEDRQLIQKYIERKQWDDMQELKNGVWLMVYQQGEGDSIQEGERITIDYKIELLDGTVCYDSDDTGLKTIITGQGKVESGVEQVLLKMRKGDHAKLIIPPYLAYGLIGDEEKIPGRSILVYDLKIME